MLLVDIAWPLQREHQLGAAKVVEPHLRKAFSSYATCGVEGLGFQLAGGHGSLDAEHDLRGDILVDLLLGRLEL